jgi:hypothetical protein
MTRTQAALAGLVVLLGVAGAVFWRAERAAPEVSPRAPVASPPAPELTESAASAEPPAPRTTASAAAAPLDEGPLMSRLRHVKDRDARLAIELAREGNRRFPDSPHAPERASILIHALASLGRASEARGEAEDMVNRYPDSEWVREIEGFTGAHRHRNLRLNDAGELESY